MKTTYLMGLLMALLVAAGTASAADDCVDYGGNLGMCCDSENGCVKMEMNCPAGSIQMCYGCDESCTPICQCEQTGNNCELQGNSCCTEGGECAAAEMNCPAGTFQACQGCDESCTPMCQCKPIGDDTCTEYAGDICCTSGRGCMMMTVACPEGTQQVCQGCDDSCTPICNCEPADTTIPSLTTAIETKVQTDKQEYNIGETAKVTISTTIYGVFEDPQMSLTAYYPSGASKELPLSGSCVNVVSEPCAPGENCRYPSAVCEFTSKVSVIEKGDYSLTAVTSIEGGSVRASTSFRTAQQSGDSTLQMKLYVDSEMQVGKNGRITATLSTTSPSVNVGNAIANAQIVSPTGETQKIQLIKGSCVTPSCECQGYSGPAEVAGAGTPGYGGSAIVGTGTPGCACAYGQSCEFTSYYTPSKEGWHTINARAEIWGTGGNPPIATSSANFNAFSGGNVVYVRLDQKFGIKISQIAEVVDYNGMRLTLEGIGGEKCIGCQKYATFMVSQSGGAGTPTAVARISVTQGNTVETIDGLKVTCHELGDSDGTFVVSGSGTSGDSVAVKVSPAQNSVRLGEMARYDIVIKDAHKGGTSSYTYRVKVSGLPFATDYETEVAVRANSEVTVPLYVYTSRYEALDEDEKEPVEMTGSGFTGMPRPANYEEIIAAKSALAETATDVEVSEVVLTAEKVAVSPTQTASGRAYKFKVSVANVAGPQATATAILNVLYGQPPLPPQDTLKLRLEQGWNLMALPGEGKLSKGSCASVDELYAFVYVKEKGEYMTMEQAKAYLGDARLAEYLRENSFWAYSFKECALEFSLTKATSMQDINLAKGWNFVPITQDMQGNTLSGISGDCDFEKLYYWDAGAQEWAKMDMSGKLGSITYPLYTGFVGKTTGSCSFGWGAILSPPPLPE